MNDITDPATLAYLLKYDSILGNLKNNVTHGKDSVIVDGKSLRVFAERDPAKIDWDGLGPDMDHRRTQNHVSGQLPADQQPVGEARTRSTFGRSRPSPPAVGEA